MSATFLASELSKLPDCAQVVKELFKLIQEIKITIILSLITSIIRIYVKELVEERIE